mmetsp:Transcript_42068/g.105040  ORF Transcript_42068/g.105040 Transcript_42068/m.105040 type:complete len:110 (+) Transcript_42068:1078-1407(+)
MNFTVEENAHYGIEGGWTTDVTFVHTCLPDEWVNSLNDMDIKGWVGDLSWWRKLRAIVWPGPYGRNFPCIETFFENWRSFPVPRIIDMTPAQVKLLGHLAAWVVEREKE